MDAAQQFKFGFLLRCADEGLTPAETQARIDRGLALMKEATWTGAATAAGMLGLAVPMAGATLAGAGAGTMAAKLTEPSISPEDVKAEELIAAYRQYADYARRANAARRYRQSMPRRRTMV